MGNFPSTYSRCEYHIASLKCYHCYEWVIFHRPIAGVKRSFSRLHNYIISLLKAALKARLRDFPMENFSKLIKYMQFQGIFAYFEPNKNQYCGKTNLLYFFLIKNIGLQLVFLVLAKIIKIRYIMHAVFNTQCL